MANPNRPFGIPVCYLSDKKLQYGFKLNKEVPVTAVLHIVPYSVYMSNGWCIVGLTFQHMYRTNTISSCSLAEAYTMGKIDHLRSIDRERKWNQMAVVNKSSAVAEMGDSLVTIDMDRKVRCSLSARGAGSPSNVMSFGHSTPTVQTGQTGQRSRSTGRTVRTVARYCESVVRTTTKAYEEGQIWPPPPLNPLTDRHQN